MGTTMPVVSPKEQQCLQVCSGNLREDIRDDKASAFISPAVWEAACGVQSAQTRGQHNEKERRVNQTVLEHLHERSHVNEGVEAELVRAFEIPIKESQQFSPLWKLGLPRLRLPFVEVVPGRLVV